MRLYLIPLTPRKAFVYGHRAVQASTKPPSILDRAITKSSDLWLQWEKGDKKWQRQLTLYGNKLFRRISYQEWSLKSIPAIPRNIPDSDRQKVPIIYPPSVMTASEIPRLLQKMGSEKSGEHKRLLIWSIIGMPIVAPFALVPVIPNIPFFYLAFRAYSHWRALQGGRHLEFLVKHNLLELQPDKELDKIYKTKIEKMTGDIDKAAIAKAAEAGTMDEVAEDYLKEELELIEEPKAKEVAEILKIPQLVVELERACEQVHEQLEKKKAEDYYYEKPPPKQKL